MIDLYLKGHALLYDTLNGQRRIVITFGAAQELVFILDLWIVLYDSLLILYMSDENCFVGLVDGVSAIISD